MLISPNWKLTEELDLHLLFQAGSIAGGLAQVESGLAAGQIHLERIPNVEQLFFS